MPFFRIFSLYCILHDSLPSLASPTHCPPTHCVLVSFLSQEISYLPLLFPLLFHIPLSNFVTYIYRMRTHI